MLSMMTDEVLGFQFEGRRTDLKTGGAAEGDRDTRMRGRRGIGHHHEAGCRASGGIYEGGTSLHAQQPPFISLYNAQICRNQALAAKLPGASMKEDLAWMNRNDPTCLTSH